jgi:hypothetical protein
MVVLTLCSARCMVCLLALSYIYNVCDTCSMLELETTEVLRSMSCCGVLKGKCALGPFLSILVIECQHKCLNVNLCSWMDKVQIKSKGMFLSLSTLVLCTNILV